MKTPLFKKGILCLFALCAAFAVGAEPANKKVKLAIIIDDLGYNRERGLQVANLPDAITAAILPLSPNGKLIAQTAAANHKELIMHLPMESETYSNLDAGGLHSQLNEEEFMQQLQADLDSIPNIRGVNNHMGSLLTQKSQPMAWLMQVLAERELFFVDSKTHPQSVARDTAAQFGVDNAERQVFLDNDLGVEDINRQFNQALRVARQYGQAIAIGHPHAETIDYLQKILPLLKQTEFEIVPVSALLTPAKAVPLASRESHGDSPAADGESGDPAQLQ